MQQLVNKGFIWRPRYWLLPAALGVVLLAIEPAGVVGEIDGSQTQRDTVTDIDGNVYHTVTIGSQVWMVENLKAAHYRDGTAIPGVLDNDEWSSLTTGAFCVSELDSSAGTDAYGLLYNFHAVNDSRGLGPAGWHVPTAAEWRTLIETLGGDEVAGGRMRETGSGQWRIPVPGSTNASGFSAIPAGGRGRFGSASDAGYYATWWSSTSSDTTYAWHWGLYPDQNSIRSNPGHKASGFSVRCIQD
ncbi:fibrobacter succinogenes major paralogous domain-containing protein [Candidatus Neomarinimicrobiota bacterium]